MEKSHNTYPQMPNMNNGSGGSSAAPPSYEQATTGVIGVHDFPPVRVLPTPNANNFAGNSPQHHPQQQQQQQQQPQQHVFVGGTSAPYVSVGNTPRSYPTQAQPASVHHPMMQQPIVIIQQQAILPLGPEPSYVLCPFCHAQSMTRISHEPSSKTHLMAALLCIFGFWCCVCLPYCADTCMNANHYCGNCNKFLGTYSDSL